MFVSPPPRVEWPQGGGPTTQTSVDIEDEDVDWAMLGVGEEAVALATGKQPATPKQSKKRSATTLLTGGAKYRGARGGPEGEPGQQASTGDFCLVER